MSTTIRVPKLGVAMTEATLVSWAVADGTAVEPGDVIYTLETDKVETEIESPVAGVLHQSASAGEVYPVGAVIGEIQA